MLLIASAIASGFCFSVIGMGYYLGARRRISLLYVGFLLFLISGLYFTARATFIPFHSSGFIYGISVFSALCGILCFILMQKAVEKGYLSSMWIALNLNFVPQALFCAIAYNEAMNRLQWMGLSTGVVCILVLSRQQKPQESPSNAADTPKSRIGYGNIAILIGLLLLNSVFLISTKVLSNHALPDHSNLMEKGGNFYYALTYALLVLSTLPYILFRLPCKAQFRQVIMPGLLGSAGVISGLTFMSYCVSQKMSGTLCFPLSSIASIIGGSLASVFLFHEKPTPYFFAGNILAAASICLFLF